MTDGNDERKHEDDHRAAQQRVLAAEKSRTACLDCAAVGETVLGADSAHAAAHERNAEDIMTAPDDGGGAAR